MHTQTTTLSTAPARPAQIALAGHGPNLGHGYVKYVVIDADGRERAAVFPAQIAPAGHLVTGALAHAETVEADGRRWWVGEDAALAPSPLTMLAQERLYDPAFLPALLRGALARIGGPPGPSACVTGLPATWAQDPDLARALGARLRGAASYGAMRVIAEPLGLLYAALLDNDGQVAGDPALASGRVAVVDGGHLTVDIAVAQQTRIAPTSLDTWRLGSAGALGQIRARLSAAFERELSLYETDMAVRAGALRVAGIDRPLPDGWDRPLIEAGAALVGRLREAWGAGGQHDVILLGGGLFALAPIADAVLAAYPHALVVERPWTAVARGYARLARRMALAERAP